jgi:CelD/BcsL family acetyltransferase involved in cellulose biosynthesis
MEIRGFSRRRRWISLPFTDECAPLARDDDSRRELARALAVAQLRLGAPSIEVRGAIDGVGWRTCASAVIHGLELEQDPEVMRHRLGRSQVTRNIARAERDGVVVRRATRHGDLEAFYALHARTRRRQGVPVQPPRFFELLWSDLVEHGLAEILLADVGGKAAVAGALFLTWNGTTIYKFGASDRESLSHRPNHLILWEAIRQACGRGDRHFDFGRTDLANDGLRAFKSGWAARERPLVYASLERGAAAGSEGLATRAMGIVIRRAPPWVCRATGNTLYRYAARR